MRAFEVPEDEQNLIKQAYYYAEETNPDEEEDSFAVPIFSQGF